MKPVNLPNLEQELGIKFKQKPLLIGGMAMEFYGIRKSGKDIDIVLSERDHKRLRAKLGKEGMKEFKGKHTKGGKKEPVLVDLAGDHGILFKDFEIWDTICGFDYKYLSENATSEKYYKIISLEKLLFLKTLAIQKREVFERRETNC